MKGIEVPKKKNTPIKPVLGAPGEVILTDQHVDAFLNKRHVGRVRIHRLKQRERNLDGRIKIIIIHIYDKIVIIFLVVKDQQRYFVRGRLG